MIEPRYVVWKTDGKLVEYALMADADFVPSEGDVMATVRADRKCRTPEGALVELKEIWQLHETPIGAVGLLYRWKRDSGRLILESFTWDTLGALACQFARRAVEAERELRDVRRILTQDFAQDNDVLQGMLAKAFAAGLAEGRAEPIAEPAKEEPTPPPPSKDGKSIVPSWIRALWWEKRS